MGLERFLNSNSEINLLKRFAFLGSRESFDNKLAYLTRVAEPENWYPKDGETTIPVIFYYVVHTFERLFEQEKIVVNESETVALANTGLMTPQGDEILFYFEKAPTYDQTKPTSCYWYLKAFLIESDNTVVRLGMPKPEIATYFTDYNELYFDANLDIVLNFDHIFGDRNERIPDEFKNLPIEDARAIFNGFLSLTKKRIKRNNRIPVPQYYRNKIMFLIPVRILGGRNVIIAVEKMGESYKGNTTLTKNMAYNCARLLTKPESNWLLVD